MSKRTTKSIVLETSSVSFQHFLQQTGLLEYHWCSASMSAFARLQGETSTDWLARLVSVGAPEDVRADVRAIVESEKNGAAVVVTDSRILPVDFYFGEGVHDVSIVFNSAENPVETATREISALPFVKGKQRAVLYGYYLKVKDAGLVTTFVSIPPNLNTRLVFWQPEHLTPLSASDWTGTQVEQLKINFKDVCNEHEFFSHLPQLDFSVRSAAQQLQTTLERLGGTLFAKYEADDRLTVYRHDCLIQHPICKALWAARKYAHRDCYTHDYVGHLLHALRFNAGMLYAAAMVKLPLLFGAVEKLAIADYLVMDVQSGCRMFVSCDTRAVTLAEGHTADSVAPVVAGGIAIAQHNRSSGRKRTFEGAVKREPAAKEVVYGIRVTGTVFHFYAMPIGDSILQAMTNQCSASEPTVFYRYKSQAGLDFMVFNHRAEILRMLSLLQGAVLC